jgi:putative membrane protein
VTETIQTAAPSPFAPASFAPSSVEPSSLAPLPAPRIEAELQEAPRLEAGLPMPLAALPVAADRGTLGLVVSGAGVLAVGFALLGAANFVVSQFDRSALLGWLTAAVAAGGFGLIGAGVWREMRGLFALRKVDRLRAALAGADVSALKAALRPWLAAQPEAGTLLAALAPIEDKAAVLALLRAGPVATLRARADALGRTAALQIFAATAALPAPAFDGLLVAWRGVRLVRQVAELHGMRPGTLATLALLRRTALSAAGVVAADLATDTAARAFLSNPLLRHVVGDVAGAGIAARRMMVLARAASAACAPL